VILDYRLFELLTADEMEGILAHELAHIESYDTFFNTLVLTTIRLFVAIVTVLLFPVIIFLTGIDRATAWIAGRPRGWTVGISQGFQYLVGIVLAGVLSILTLLFLSYSRRREYQADRRAGEMTGKPVALARALSKIHRATDPRRDLRSFLYIHDDPQREHYPFLSTHPPLDKRVNRLLEQTDAEYSTQQIDRVRS
jgi:heat shock protein HtpX